MLLETPGLGSLSLGERVGISTMVVVGELRRAWHQEAEKSDSKEGMVGEEVVEEEEIGSEISGLVRRLDDDVGHDIVVVFALKRHEFLDEK